MNCTWEPFYIVLTKKCAHNKLVKIKATLQTRDWFFTLFGHVNTLVLISFEKY